MKNQVIENEILILAKECRLYAKGKRASSSLQRVAASLESLVKSINDQSISTDNPLTERERELLDLLALGYSNKELASAFSISIKTIEYHISSIFKKTHASKRTEAVVNASKFEWLKIR